MSTKTTSEPRHATTDRVYIDPAMLTIPSAVAFSGLSRSRLYELFAQGMLHPRRAGRRTLIQVDELRNYLTTLPLAPIRISRPREAA